MKIEYDSKSIEKVCTNASIARKEYGDRMAELIHQRIDEITAADSIEQLIQFRVGACHSLLGKHKGQYAINLIQPYRLIFKKKNKVLKIVSII